MAATFNGTLSLDNSSVKNRHISGAVADIISTDKVQPVYIADTNLGFAIGATPTTREETIYVAKGAGTVRGFHALLSDTGTTTNIAFDLKKNDVTMLSAPIAITDAASDRAVSDATLSVTTFVLGDVISAAMTVTTSTGAKGPYMWAVITENTAPAA